MADVKSLSLKSTFVVLKLSRNGAHRSARFWFEEYFCSIEITSGRLITISFVAFEEYFCSIEMLLAIAGWLLVNRV